MCMCVCVNVVCVCGVCVCVCCVCVCVCLNECVLLPAKLHVYIHVYTVCLCFGSIVTDGGKEDKQSIPSGEPSNAHINSGAEGRGGGTMGMGSVYCMCGDDPNLFPTHSFPHSITLLARCARLISPPSVHDTWLSSYNTCACHFSTSL